MNWVQKNYRLAKKKKEMSTEIHKTNALETDHITLKN